MTTGHAIAAEAREWLGTRYHHQASKKGVACDCIGLVGGVALVLGLPGAKEWAEDPELHCYGKTPDPIMLVAACDRLLERIPMGEATIGDVLVMAFERDPQHFAIISREYPRYLIHAYAQARKVVENGANMHRAKPLRAYRFRGVA